MTEAQDGKIKSYKGSQKVKSVPKMDAGTVTRLTGYLNVRN